MLVKEIMTKNPLTVSPDFGIGALADLFVDKNISGVPVVDGEGVLLGVVLEEGLIFHDKKVHLPSFLHILGGFITLGVKRFEDEMEKITASKVSDIMEEDLLTVAEDDTIADVATRMIETGIYYCPVLNQGRLRGVITKKDIVKSIAFET